MLVAFRRENVFWNNLHLIRVVILMEERKYAALTAQWEPSIATSKTETQHVITINILYETEQKQNIISEMRKHNFKLEMQRGCGMESGDWDGNEINLKILSIFFEGEELCICIIKFIIGNNNYKNYVYTSVWVVNNTNKWINEWPENNHEWSASGNGCNQRANPWLKGTVSGIEPARRRLITAWAYWIQPFNCL